MFNEDTTMNMVCMHLNATFRKLRILTYCVAMNVVYIIIITYIAQCSPLNSCSVNSEIRHVIMVPAEPIIFTLYSQANS